MSYEDLKELRRAAKAKAVERRRELDRMEKLERELEIEAIKFVNSLGNGSSNPPSRTEFRISLQSTLANYFAANPETTHWRASFPRTVVLMSESGDSALLSALGKENVLRFLYSLAKEGYLGSRIEGNLFFEFIFFPKP